MMPIEIVFADSQATRGFCYLQQFVRRCLGGCCHRKTRHCGAAALFKLPKQARKLFDWQLTGNTQHKLEFIAHIFRVILVHSRSPFSPTLWGQILIRNPALFCRYCL